MSFPDMGGQVGTIPVISCMRGHMEMMNHLLAGGRCGNDRPKIRRYVCFLAFFVGGHVRFIPVKFAQQGKIPTIRDYCHSPTWGRAGWNHRRFVVVVAVVSCFLSLRLFSFRFVSSVSVVLLLFV